MVPYAVKRAPGCASLPHILAGKPRQTRVRRLGSLEGMENAMRTRPFPGLLVGALILVLTACSGAGDSKPNPPPAARQITVTIGQLRFQPPSLALQAGHPVEITVRNIDMVEHDFVIRGMPAT